jgi:GGDEF domain-containing protein
MTLHYDPTDSAPMRAIVRVAVIVVTLALFSGSTLNAWAGQRDLSILFALATPLGISAWGFARAGHNEAAIGLLCAVLTVVVTLVLAMTPLGVHDVALIAYAGILMAAALLLSRRAFYAIAVLTIVAATCVFAADIMGFTRSKVGRLSDWTQLVEFLVIIGVFAVLGRYGAEVLLGSLGDAHRASAGDPITGLANRAGFLAHAATRIKETHGPTTCGILVLSDLTGFRRINVVIGHQAADGVLREAGDRVAGAARGHLTGRIGDDEFAVLAVGLPDEDAAVAYACRYAA